MPKPPTGTIEAALYAIAKKNGLHHKDCGGEIIVRRDLGPYEYVREGYEQEDGKEKVSLYYREQCSKCWEWILGDADIQEEFDD